MDSNKLIRLYQRDLHHNTWQYRILDKLYHFEQSRRARLETRHKKQLVAFCAKHGIPTGKLCITQAMLDWNNAHQSIFESVWHFDPERHAVGDIARVASFKR
jgi:hypothetical protein